MCFIQTSFHEWIFNFMNEETLTIKKVTNLNLQPDISFEFLLSRLINLQKSIVLLSWLIIICIIFLQFVAIPVNTILIIIWFPDSTTQNSKWNIKWMSKSRQLVLSCTWFKKENFQMFSVKNNELSYVHNRKLLTLTRTKNEMQLKYYKKD